jgi:hypothetical protein
LQIGTSGFIADIRKRTATVCKAESELAPRGFAVDAVVTAQIAVPYLPAEAGEVAEINPQEHTAPQTSSF